MLCLSLLLLCGACASHVAAARGATEYLPEDYEYHFETFMAQYGKQYSGDKEKQMRFQIFTQNLEDINRKNRESEHAVYGVNQFTDLTSDEFKITYTGYMVNFGDDQCDVKTGMEGEVRAPPENFDWRDKNKVTPVKDQLFCGSCWAFSAIGNLEGQYAIKHNELVSFSEQQLVDCDHRSGGCGGGDMSNASRYFIENGAMTEDAYPYTGQNGECEYDAKKVTAKGKSCNLYNKPTEDQLLEILYNVGPLSIGIDATDLQGYNKGIMTSCKHTSPDHGVLLVGYGTENGVPYWTFKNSWGTIFGEKGYFRVKRGIDGCGLTDFEIQSVVL